MNQKLNTELNKPGYWTQSSTVDWCEPDYQHSYLIAETFNTFSNAIYLLGTLLFYMQVRSLYVTQYRKRYGSSSTVPKRWYVMMWSTSMVGIGSWMFHMTLLYSFQMMDEISMIIGMMCAIFSCLTLDDYKQRATERLKFSGQIVDPREQKRQESIHHVLTMFGLFQSVQSMLVMTVCVIVFAFLLVVYDPMDPIMFQGMFIMLTVCLVVLLYRQAYGHTKKFPAYSNSNGKTLSAELNCNGREEAVKRAVHMVNRHAQAKKTTLTYSIISMVLAGIVWNMDNLTCPRYEHLKLHSLWHLFSAMGCYYLSPLILLSYHGNRHDEWVYEMLTRSASERSVWIDASCEPMNVDLSWHFFGLLPWVSIAPSAAPSSLSSSSSSSTVVKGGPQDKHSNVTKLD